MATPSSIMTEIVTTTLRNRTGELADNVTKNNALLNRLKKKAARSQQRPAYSNFHICFWVHSAFSCTLALK